MGLRMFWQWPVLAIQPLTTLAGVENPAAMFSPTFDQSNPTAVIRAEKSAPWLNRRWLTMVLVQPWAERFSRELALSAGRCRLSRSMLTRQTTAACSWGAEASPIGVWALAHPGVWDEAAGASATSASATAAANTAVRRRMLTRARVSRSRKFAVSGLVIDTA